MQPFSMAQVADSQKPDAPSTQSTNRANLIRLILIIVAIGKVVSSLSSLVVLFDNDPGVPGTSWGGLVISATIALGPFLAAAALIFAVRGPIGRAIIAIAALALLDWLSYVPSVIKFWSEFPGPGYVGLHGIVQMVVLPILAVTAIILAWRGARLGLAASLALVPTLVNILGVIAFGIGVAIYGF
jgi:hypothetical protein